MKHILLSALLCLTPALANAVDSREGYYYPPVTSEERFERVLGAAPPANGVVRTNFINQIAKGRLQQPQSPRFAIFAKGGESEHMVIIALDDDVFRTLFRARAVLAELSSGARNTEFFVKNGISTVATWFDLAKILGFDDIVISDGLSWSHRVVLNAAQETVPPTPAEPLGKKPASE